MSGRGHELAADLSRSVRRAAVGPHIVCSSRSVVSSRPGLSWRLCLVPRFASALAACAVGKQGCELERTAGPREPDPGREERALLPFWLYRETRGRDPDRARMWSAGAVELVTARRS
jgi:hypothetical protein